MINTRCINLFYEEPDPDRWFLYDRYPRRMIHRLIRGRPMIGGMQRIFLNLRKGLDRLAVSYRVNDYRYCKNHPYEAACIIGKPHLLDKTKWKNPILFGSAVFSHPVDDPHLLDRLPVKAVLVACEWMRQMFEPYYGKKVMAWPVGIDTDMWSPSERANRDIDFLIYDKIWRDRPTFEKELLNPIITSLEHRQLTTQVIRYGYYREHQFHALLQRSKNMVFLCEHETQGLAYQQALSCNVPILAWDPGGFWPDDHYYPHKVKFQPVTSVPYWDDRCGFRFQDVNEFPNKLEQFLFKAQAEKFNPRAYILENLTLEKCAQRYVDIWNFFK